jgi:hypothetical protein
MGMGRAAERIEILNAYASPIPVPWSLDELEPCFVVKDGAGAKSGVIMRTNPAKDQRH